MTERRRRALEMRGHGATYDQIARALGYADPSGAFQAVREGLRATLQEPADELRILVRERLDCAFRAWWPKAIGFKDEAGNMIPPDGEAMDRVLRIMKRQAELLGLDSPVRHDMTTGGESVAPITIVEVHVPDGAGVEEPRPGEARRATVGNGNGNGHKRRP